MKDSYCAHIYRLSCIGARMIGDISTREVIEILLNQALEENRGQALRLFKKHNIPANTEGCSILAETIHTHYNK